MRLLGSITTTLKSKTIYQDVNVKSYVLQSTRYHGALIKDAQSRDPKVFGSRLQAWMFKARRRKWHWRVVAHQPVQRPRHTNHATVLRAA